MLMMTCLSITSHVILLKFFYFSFLRGLARIFTFSHRIFARLLMLSEGILNAWLCGCFSHQFVQHIIVS